MSQKPISAKKCPLHLNTKKQPQSCCLFDFLLNFLCLNVPETYYLLTGDEFFKVIKRTLLKSVLFIWAAVDSNHRPHPYQGCALTT